MEILGIKFAPLYVPLKRRLQTLAAAAWLLTIAFGGIAGAFLALYLVLYTTLRYFVVPYLIWVYLLDRNTAESGGRMSPWVRNWVWWRYLKDYFPLHFENPKNIKLDPKKNYLFGCFPHGVLPTGAFNAFVTSYGGFKEKFPHHESYVATLPQQFILPFCRELMLGLGAISCSVKSIEHVLRNPSGGSVLTLVIGGARESYYCKPGTNRIILKPRKGFVRLALRNGVSLVPVYSFGETELYDQLDGPRLRKVQEFLRKWIRMAPVIPVGRGFFQYSFGIIPRRHPVTTVVGIPIEVPKIEKPTQEDVDKYHALFIRGLTDLFEEYKYKYLDEPESKTLIID